MRFHLDQIFRALADDVARAYTDPALYELLGQLPKLGRPQVLERRGDGEVVHLQVRYHFTGDLSPAVRRVLDPDRLSWVEHATHDLARREVDFRLVPDHYGDMLRSSGRYRFEEQGELTRKVAEGDLSVRVPIVGGSVERAIVSGLREHFREETGVVERFLADGRAGH
jgi:Protein of unknown function (DUF2505)